jgi:hypothetical protein
MTKTRPVLWILLIACAVANVVTSASNLVLVSVGFGLLTLAFGGTLVAQHYRHRRSG